MSGFWKRYKKRGSAGLIFAGAIILFSLLLQSPKKTTAIDLPYGNDFSQPNWFSQPAIPDIPQPIIYNGRSYPIRPSQEELDLLRTGPPAGWTPVGDYYVDPYNPPGPSGGSYVQTEGGYAKHIGLTKWFDSKNHTPMPGFTPIAISFKIKTKAEFDFSVSRVGGSLYFEFDLPSDYSNKLDEALLDGNWQVVEKNLDLPSNYNQGDHEFKAFKFGYHFVGEGGFCLGDIILTSDEGEKLVLDDFEYDDEIGNHGWELGAYDEDYFEPLIPVYDDELGSRVFECNESYKIRGPGRYVYKAGDTLYPFAWPDIYFPGIDASSQSSPYTNTDIYRSSLTSGYSFSNPGFQYPSYSSPYPFGSQNPIYSSPYGGYGSQNPNFTSPYQNGFSNQPPLYGSGSSPLWSGGGGYSTPYGNQGYGLRFSSPPSYGGFGGGFGYPGVYPGFGSGWFGGGYPYF